jgi:hypothetical protein
MIRPFLDHPIQFAPATTVSRRLSSRTTLAGSSALCDLDTLQTRKSPSCVCTASMSDFCRDDEACHASVTMGDGALCVVRLCRIVKRGCSVATSKDPFWYLVGC